MHITRTTLEEATAKGVLNKEQSDALWSFLSEREADTPTFKPAHIMYYLGGLIAIGAMTVFMTLVWERFEGIGLLVISACYGGIAFVLAEYLLGRRNLAIPAGFFATLGVTLVPVAIFGAQNAMGLWAQGQYHPQDLVDWRWTTMHLGTLAAGAISLWRYRRPFIEIPVVVTLWRICMDVTPLIVGGQSIDIFSGTGQLVSIFFGLAMTLLALWVDTRSLRSNDFAFWLYFFGVLAFWCSLTSMNSNSEVGAFFYCCINFLMIAIGAALSRRVFAVFGAIGVSLYLGHLSYAVFKDSMLFPIALSAIGLLVIAAGVLWQRHEAAIGAWLRSFLPKTVLALIAHRASY